MQPTDLDAEAALEVRREQPAPLRELREAQHLVALRQDLVEKLLGTSELARPAGQRRAVAQEVRGMVAHLLQPHEPGQHEPAPAHTLRLLRLREQSSTTA